MKNKKNKRKRLRRKGEKTGRNGEETIILKTFSPFP